MFTSHRCSEISTYISIYYCQLHVTVRTYRDVHMHALISVCDVRFYTLVFLISTVYPVVSA